MTEKEREQRVIELTYTGVRYCSGMTFACKLYVPEVPQDTPLGVIVTHDGLIEAEVLAMEKLAKTGDAPYCACIGIDGGAMSPTRKEGYRRGMRLSNYDFFDSCFADFLVEELIPYLQETYHLNLSKDPNMHMAAGGSSGGISAWNCVWFRNDYFRRAYLSSPSFLAMDRGNMAQVFMRLYETKPIRVYVDYSETEPDDYFGSSYCVAMEAQRALQFAGYDYAWNYYPGEGHCSRYHDEKTAEEIFLFLWKDWDTKPVEPNRSITRSRCEVLVSMDDPWEVTEEGFPEKAEAVTERGVYKIKGEEVQFCTATEERKVAEGYPHLVSLAVSSDLWRLYLADASRGCLYAASICEDGSLKDTMRFASLYRGTDFSYQGAFDICVDMNDRIFVATELGIQCVRSYGLIDAILPLPGNAIPQKVAFGGEGMQYLYADCGNQVYRRKMKFPGKQNPLEITEPKFTSYYD